MFYKDSCYFQSSVMKNWQSAEKNCVEKGLHLVVVNDLAELVRQEHIASHKLWEFYARLNVSLASF